MAHPQAEAHGSLSSYATGFILSVLLTAGAFGIVLHGSLDASTALIAIAVLAFVQVVVHLVFFLHLNSSGQGWNVLSLAYTVLAAAFLIFGTIWVMHNVSMNMMSR
ncbi:MULTISPECIES: cytochrome o ubiquinol oxidase subunit IV [Paraburkholderia]|uniref:Cytochrome bo(3) ubiquinol oxidase subunit 4 n=1 Tax=Paraburkholderia tropica TaxID=92647 RepID=A0A1A5XM51_9BURK|nr:MULTISPECIES: cytochrome o ubiquinol oxidase subunit IV [Paraburkholderia]MBB2978442.1 cytochrome o ubiquinol oxidase operon protein cyoD [Paraburkholderia tropica]MBB2998637.1 cytochrome o ubiquinol oxidase operon protein cyoD [Paraburkholderia tropica]MBB6318588.1 cytochrome o ubiquinol oxidase operon protein cyoD [Paraburkholderia tropica]MDE1139503.1 cytochrome o ubiquinol oxidase subunit IV [Paraburkholderia tropica]OBR54497.1 cytochrome o ubiquinol oxidase subunit IV [Paraburkholderia